MVHVAKVLTLLTCAVFAPAAGTANEVISFDGSWKKQGFLRLFSNDFGQRGRQLDIVSDGTVSLLWRPVKDLNRSVESARWVWRVHEGVRPTDLTIKGGDDRNLAIYFVFVDPERVDALSGKSARRILQEDSARALIYVWGGAHPTNAILPSPYSPRLRSKVLRPSEIGQYREQVDLASDHRTAFGIEPGALIGLAVSADSDDTKGRIVASISDLQLD